MFHTFGEIASNVLIGGSLLRWLASYLVDRFIVDRFIIL